MLNALTLAALLHACAAPLPAPLDRAQVGVILVESGGDAWAMHDNNTKRSYYPRTFDQAVALEQALIAGDEAIHGRGIDVGIAQVNSHNFAEYGLSPVRALHACDNIAASSKMLSGTYADEESSLAAAPRPLRDYLALDRTLQIYNSGRSSGDAGYTLNVESAAQSQYVARTLAFYRGRDNKPGSTRATRVRARKPPSTCFAGCASSESVFASSY